MHSTTACRAARRARAVAALGTLSTLAVTATACDEEPTAVPRPEAGAPVASKAPAEELVPDQYIVVFKNEVTDPPALARSLVATHGGSLRFTFRHSMKGFDANLPAPALEAVRRHPAVDFISPVHRLRLEQTTQTNAPWGLDRIDQYTGLDSTYSFNTTGQGVTVYVIDTGIETGHRLFGGRARRGFDVSGGNSEDCEGHGTSVAGVVGGDSVGVARGVSLVSVRVTDCFGGGDSGTIAAGVEWVTGDHDPGELAAANMSVSVPQNDALDRQVRNLMGENVVVVAAAGNDRTDACLRSPGHIYEAITVGAVDINSQRPDWSNRGPCVDMFAPGVNIPSASLFGQTDFNTGTSFAAPHITGLVARLLGQFPWMSRDELVFHVKGAGKVNQVGDVFASANLLAHWEPVLPPGHLRYRAHVAFAGWQPEVLTDFRIAGTVNEDRRLEAITARLVDIPGSICYQVYAAGLGWMSPVCNDQIAGTVGQSRQLEGVRMWLVDSYYQVCYDAHVANVGWVAAGCDGAVVGFPGSANRKIEGLRVWIPTL
jgi:subtilisin family serine protease